MKFTNVISKEVTMTSNALTEPIKAAKNKTFWNKFRHDDKVFNPFSVIVQKEIADFVRSWRFKILLLILALTCMGSLYTALTNISDALKSSDNDPAFLFLKLFTVSDGTLPSFLVFISFLGPLLGIGLGFDAINTERNSGTLSRILSQPIHRDYLINAKFIASITVISISLFALVLMVVGLGLLFTGIPPTPEELIRIVLFTVVSILYIAFWLNLSILFSVRFQHAATSALAGIAVWLFFSIFFNMIVNILAKATAISQYAPEAQLIAHKEFILNLMRISPNQLYSEATSTLLVPSVRSLGPLSMTQLHGTVPGPIPIGQSILLIWPLISVLIAITVLCFVASYVQFMRKEIRSK